MTARLALILALLGAPGCRERGPTPRADTARADPARAGATRSDPAEVVGRATTFDSAGQRWRRWVQDTVVAASDGTPVAVRIERTRVYRDCCGEALRGSPGGIAVQRWPGREREGAPRWEVHLAGDTAAFANGFLRTMTVGGAEASDTPDIYRFYSLDDGTLRFVQQGVDSLATGPNGEHGAFASKDEAADFPELAGRKDVAGLIQYAPPRGTVEHVLLRDAKGEVWYGLSGVEFSRDSLGLALRVALWVMEGEDPPEVVLRLRDGALELGDALAPPGLALERVGSAAARP
ncbi:MAG: hypothetical protein ACJ8AO_10000 [Gemmatimonadaceae bacterium]